MRVRPMGVTILASLLALSPVSYAALAALSVFHHGTLVAVLHALSPSGAGPESLHTAIGRLQPFYYSAMAILSGALAVGFWRFHNWARIVVLGMIELSLLLLVTEVRPLLIAPTAFSIVVTLVRIAVSLSCLVYLFRRPVRAAFHRQAVPA